MDRYYLGLDAGTSGLKALLMDWRGTVVGQATAPYDLATPRPGWVESDPDIWWTALCLATRGALNAAGIDGASVAAIGLCGQMHTLVLLDDHNRPVRPAISWADARGAEERAELEARVGRDHLIEITGSPAVTAFTATKLLWVRRHEPELWARARLALLAKDYLRLRLTGEVASDPSDAGAAGLLDLTRRDWSAEVLGALDLPRELLPPLLPSAVPAGAVTHEAAAETGLRAGTPVATGAGDQECAALGCGVTEPGPLLITVGTGGQLFAATNAPLIDRLGRLHTLPHALPDRWHVLAAIPAAGLALTWLRGVIGPMEPGPATKVARQESATEVAIQRTREATATSAAFHHAPPIFVPALAGERTPTMDEAARGAFVGLNLTHTAADLHDAAREGVAFALRLCVETLADLGLPLNPIAVTGGLSGDPAFLSLLANVLARPVDVAAQRDGSAYGAALLGALAAGATVPSAPMLSDMTIQPDQARVVWHERRYTVYTGLCAALNAQPREPQPLEI